LIDVEKKELIHGYLNKKVNVVIDFGSNKPYYYNGKIIKVTDTSFIIKDIKEEEILLSINNLIQIKEIKKGDKYW